MGDHVQTPQLLTRDEVAERLKLSIVTIDRLRRQGDLEFVKFGRAVRIPVQSVTAFLARKAVRS